jgi:hypothetical protein
MIIRDLQEMQELVFRTWVSNLMFLATLPYHVSQEEAVLNPARARASAVAGHRRRAISDRPPHRNGRDDVRWLR